MSSPDLRATTSPCRFVVRLETFGPSVPLEDLQDPVVYTCTLRNWNPRPACGTAFSSVHNISSVCVCVSPPVPKGSTSLSAGDGDTCIASPSTKLAIHGEDISSGRGTAFNTPTPMIHPAAVRCFHGCSHDRPQNLFPPQTCSRLAAALSVRSLSSAFAKQG